MLMRRAICGAASTAVTCAPSAQGGAGQCASTGPQVEEPGAWGWGKGGHDRHAVASEERDNFVVLRRDPVK